MADFNTNITVDAKEMFFFLEQTQAMQAHVQARVGKEAAAKFIKIQNDINKQLIDNADVESLRAFQRERFVQADEKTKATESKSLISKA